MNQRKPSALHDRQFLPLVLTFLALLASLEFLRFGTFLPEQQGTVKIRAALWISENGEPAKVRLPHSIDDEPSRSPNRRGRYIIEWPQEKLGAALYERDWAILLPRVASQFRVLINDAEIERIGWQESGLSDYLSGVTPRLIIIPRWILGTSSERPTVMIDVAGYPLDRAGISSVWIGEAKKLRSFSDRLAFWQNTITGASAIFGLVVAILAAYTSFYLSDKKYLWLFACSLLFGARSAVLLFNEAWGNSFVLLFAIDRSLLILVSACFVVTIQKFLLRNDSHDPLRLGWIQPAAALTTATALFLVWLSVIQQEYFYIKWAASIMLVFSAAGFFWAAAQFIRNRPDDYGRWPLVMGALFVLICGARDFLAIQIGIGGDGDFRWMTAGSMVLLIIMAGNLTSRLAATSARLKRVASTLHERVEQREQELRAAYEELRLRDIIEHRQKERRTIMRNLHDGLGTLLSSLNAVVGSMPADTPQKTCAEDLLRQSINTLRLTLDSMEPHEGSPPALLGMLRRRLWDGIRAKNIEIKWKVQDVPPAPQLEHDQAAHEFLMLASEAFNNIIKHSHASKLTVSTHHEDNAVIVKIEDDGVGINGDLPRSLEEARQQNRGYGLINMFERAARCGAELRFYHANPGLGIEIRFDLSGATTILLDSALS